MVFSVHFALLETISARSDIIGKVFRGLYIHDRYDHIVATIYQYTVFKKHAFDVMYSEVYIKVYGINVKCISFYTNLI